MTSLHMLQKTNPLGMAGRSVQNSRALERASAPKARQVETAQAEHVHPSWLAKQKQKEALIKAVPVGSKTVFSDDGHSVMSTLTPAVDAGTSRVVPARRKQQAVQSETLHPSWLAKKAAASKEAQLASRPLATKIVFDD